MNSSNINLPVLNPEEVEGYFQQMHKASQPQTNKFIQKAMLAPCRNSTEEMPRQSTLEESVNPPKQSSTMHPGGQTKYPFKRPRRWKTAARAMISNSFLNDH
ncbi:hypothetical protein CRM22_001339 [Opisthorchis felineus]|uniref:Uncharacterized protein n=1 Tax=Opisthorchis felineus TaxID=147828 RepID=A0A4S2MB06_OPIFE|nr:hypothetical protein CRM22_001339 [Opisthorchis felineus]